MSARAAPQNILAAKMKIPIKEKLFLEKMGMIFLTLSTIAKI
jgi:hypothetical protein